MSLVLNQPDSVLAQRFRQLKTPLDVAVLLDVTLAALTFHLYRSDPASRYSSFAIPKRRGGDRTIRAPASALKILQRKLNQVLQAVYAPQPSAHGFTRSRSIVTNATPHMRAQWILNVDLADFFGSVNFGRVRGMFLAKPYQLPPAVATVLAQICCFENQLPQGAPTSPVITNMICSRLDTRLRRLAKRHRCYYTRYADDLTFSTRSRQFPRALAEASEGGVQLGAEILQILSDEGFVVNHAKSKLCARDVRQEVTGLVVNEFVNVRRVRIRQIRAMLHAWRRHGYNAAEGEFHSRWDSSKHRRPGAELPSFRNVLRGRLSFVGAVRGKADRVYIDLVNQARRLDRPFFESLQTLEDAIWIVHTDDLGTQGTAFFLEDYGLITCGHVAVSPQLVVRKSETASRIYRANVVRRSGIHDLAILSPNAPRLHPLRLGSSSLVRTGDELRIYGYPQWIEDQTLNVTRAVVTGRRPVHCIPRIIVGSPIIPGTSGGPVLNMAGEVVGVAARGSGSHRAENESAIIPIEFFLQLLHVPLGRENELTLFCSQANGSSNVGAPVHPGRAPTLTLSPRAVPSHTERAT